MHFTRKQVQDIADGNFEGNNPPNIRTLARDWLELHTTLNSTPKLKPTTSIDDLDAIRDKANNIIKEVYDLCEFEADPPKIPNGVVRAVLEAADAHFNK